MKTGQTVDSAVSVGHLVKNLLSKVLCVAATTLCFAFPHAAAQTPSPTPFSQRQEQEANLVHFGDLVDVDFVGGFEFDWRGTIRPDGFLDGFQSYEEPIYALCRSESEIAADVVKAYSKILRDPKVIVKILDRSSRAVVQLSGAVKFPQRFQIRRVVSLRELLVIAGGVTDEASGEIMVFHPRNLSCGDMRLPSPDKANAARVGNGAETLEIKISELLTGNTAANPMILSGDIITVTKAVPIYVIGAVNNPRQVYSRSQITVTRAIASAGGLAKGAVGEKVTVYRREGEKSTVIEVDLGKIKTSQSTDVVLKPFDIIEVPRKGGEKRKYPPVVASADLRGQGNGNLPLRIID